MKMMMNSIGACMGHKVQYLFKEAGLVVVDFIDEALGDRVSTTPIQLLCGLFVLWQGLGMSASQRDLDLYDAELL